MSKDLSNKRVGRLLVIELTDKRLHGNIVWKCLCDCGNTTFVSSNRLSMNSTRSCGCLKKENMKRLGLDRRNLNEKEAGRNALYSKYKSRATKNNIEFNL